MSPCSTMRMEVVIANVHLQCIAVQRNCRGFCSELLYCSSAINYNMWSSSRKYSRPQAVNTAFIFKSDMLRSVMYSLATETMHFGVSRLRWSANLCFAIQVDPHQVTCSQNCFHARYVGNSSHLVLRRRTTPAIIVVKLWKKDEMHSYTCALHGGIHCIRKGSTCPPPATEVNRWVRSGQRTYHPYRCR